MRALIALLAMTGTAAAHRWYDTSCCSDRDCHPVQANEIQITPSGYKIHGTIVSYGAAKQSLDRNCHVCVYASAKRSVAVPAPPKARLIIGMPKPLRPSGTCTGGPPRSRQDRSSNVSGPEHLEPRPMELK